MIPPRINLTSYIGAKYMLERKEQFNVTWGAATDFVMTPGGADFMLSVPALIGSRWFLD